MNESLDLGTQRSVFDIIQKNPGIHVSKIAEMLNTKLIFIQESVRNLQKNKQIICIENDGCKRYYIEETRPSILEKRMAHTRRKILDLIMSNPGLHFSKIAGLLNMRLSLAEYHLRNMEQDHVIIAAKDVGYYKRFFAAGINIGVQERKIISLLREDVPLKIVIFLLQHPAAKHKEILKNIGITSSTLSYHLNKLVEYEVLESPTYENEKGYRIKNKEQLLVLLKNFRLLTQSKSFTNVWDDLKFKA